MRLWILSVHVLLAAGASGQEPTAPSPPSLMGNELAMRARAAIQELTRLEATAKADREAFRESEADLERTIGEFQKPLPELPASLETFSDYRYDAIRAEARKADDYLKAWELRQVRHRRASGLLEQLTVLSETLRGVHEQLLDRAADLRAVLIETQRKIERRELPLSDLQLAEGAPSVTDWIVRTAELVSGRDELLHEVDTMIERLAVAAAQFEKLPHGDAEGARIGRRIEISLAQLAEASAVSDVQRSRLEQAPAETVPSEIARAVEEWKARGAALETTVLSVSTAHADLRAVLEEEARLQVPRREDIPAGEGLPEIREARQTLGLASRIVSYYEKAVELLEKANAGRAALLAVIASASERHAEYTRQSARMMVWLQHAAKLRADGALAGWTEPEGVSQQLVWDGWRRRQIEQVERLELAAEVRTGLVSAEDIGAARAKIAEEVENEKRAASVLETEQSYAEFVARMAGQTVDQLLSLLAPDGEIARNVAALVTARRTIEESIEEVTERCLRAVRALQTNENPYSQSVLRESADELATIRRALESLDPGKPYADDTTAPAPIERPSRLSLREALQVEKDDTADELAEKESRYLASEQQFARFFLDYFVNLETSLRQLRQAVRERRDLDAQLETKLDEIIREEKRRYAAARQFLRYVEQGALDASRIPKDLEGWLGRVPILEASDDLRRARRASDSFHARATYEVDRLEQLMAGIDWMKVRSGAADARVRLIDRPLAHLSAALTPIASLNDVDRKNLEYQARAAESREDPSLEALLERFTDEVERRRFEDPLTTYYLELANSERVTADLKAAETAYDQMAEICLDEKEKLAPLRSLFEKTVALRRSDYEAARYTAAVIAHPSARARLEEAFRTQYDRDLPYRLDSREGNVDLAAEMLHSSRARLRAEMSVARDADLLLSKVGLDQEIGWYRSQIARLGTLMQKESSRQNDLEQRIERLRTTYSGLLESNAMKGLSVTLAIPLVAFLVVRVMRRLARRFEARVMLKQDEEFSDRQRRLQTVSKTTAAATSVLVWTIAIVYVFARLGLDITPIVASASVVGLAVAFGAQTLIKDFFSGFFILIENQFTIGDVVTLGTITGTVENISLRITVLRDLKGVVHYIPNGSIGQVSNQTQGWSRVVMEISVSYREDPDRVTDVLAAVLLEMARDDAWRREIIEDPVVAGVEMLTERSVDIRVMVKTRPGQQWAVAREARRRIKRRFDELGIEVPFPQRIVHHVYEGTERAANEGEPRAERRPRPEERGEPG